MIVGFSNLLAKELLFSLSIDRERLQQRLNQLPLGLSLSIRSSRLKLGAFIHGTRHAGSSMQLLPEYTRNIRCLTFLRGVFKFIKSKIPDSMYNILQYLSSFLKSSS